MPFSLHDQIIQLEVFEHYMVLVLESNKERKLRVVSLKTGKAYENILDSASDRKDLILEDNLCFSDSEVRVREKLPHCPDNIYKVALGTRQPQLILQDHVSNFKQGDIVSEKIEVEVRDGVSVPIFLKYSKHFFSDKSPWIMSTNGSSSSRTDTYFQPN